MRIGEIIATSSTAFVAESFDLNRPPALGSLVKAAAGDDGEIYAVVSHGETRGLDPGRMAVRRSTEEVYDQAIYREHPELQRTLRTEFTALLVGSSEAGRVRQHIPAQPPPLHYTVHLCTADEVRHFTERLYYFRLLLAAVGEVPPQQLLAANVRQTYQRRGDDAAWLDRAAQEIARLLKQDYESLMTVLYAIEQEVVED